MVGGHAAFSKEVLQKLAHNLSPHAEEAPKAPSRSTRAPRARRASFETPTSWAPQDEGEAFETGTWQPVNTSDAVLFGEVPMQLAPQESQTSTSKKWDWMIPVAMLTVALAAFVGSVSYAVFSVETWAAKRNADLVMIGVSVLRVDPEKEKQLSDATRKWALDLIDANAGDVKFSPEARAQLLREPLKYSSYIEGIDYYGYTPDKPPPRGPSAEPPK